MNSGCAAALDRLQDFCFMAIKAANREPCTPPRSTLILTPAFIVYTELGIDPMEFYKTHSGRYNFEQLSTTIKKYGGSFAWVFGLGKAVRIAGPESVKGQMKTALADIAARYEE